MSPTSDVDRPTAPLYSSTPLVPRSLANGHSATDHTNNDNFTDNDNNRIGHDNVDSRVSTDNGIDNAEDRDSVDNIIDNIDSRIDAVKSSVGSIVSRIGSVDNVDSRPGNEDGVFRHFGKRLGKVIDNYDTLNGNVNVNVVSESTNSMDVLSGGESDAGDTLTRRNNNNSIASGVTGIGDTARRRGADVTYYIAKELLMTERTYKRDLELITVSWSKRVGKLGRTSSSGAEAGALARGCLALEPLALPAGGLLARLDRLMAAATAAPATTATTARTDDTEEPEYKKIAELLHDYLSTTFDAYMEYISNAGALVALVESARRRGGAAAREASAFGCLALPAGALLACTSATTASTDDTEEPEYKKIAELLHDYLSTTFDAYMEYISNAGALVALVESARRRGGAAAREASAFDSAAPLPLACLLLRPLHRLLHLAALAEELWSSTNSQSACAALKLARRGATAAAHQLHHVENHAALCQLQRDLIGYDKLLVAGREFVRLGCLYKHSSKGLQQRMLFLFSDMLVITCKCASGRFRAQRVLPLRALSLAPSDLPHSFSLTGEDVNILLSTSTEQEYVGWRDSLAAAIESAQDNPTDIDTELTPCDNDADACESSAGSSSSSSAGGGCGALAGVCWHRAASLSRRGLHAAMQTQLSGYLLRKFKNSHGWQKLWVVFAAFTLFFYKSWHDETPLASLPLLGYSVGAPSESDGINKDFVFKLQFKNHVYFFRADSHFTYNRWIEVLRTPMVQSHHN